MGLDIEIMNRNTDFRLGSYSILHWIRALAIFTDNKIPAYEIAKQEEEKSENWKAFPEFFHLLHFSDCEGMYVPGQWLKEVKYRDSFYLSNSTELLRELRLIRTRITLNPDKYKKMRTETAVLERFEFFLNQLEAEIDDYGDPTIRFY